MLLRAVAAEIRARQLIDHQGPAPSGHRNGSPTNGSPTNGNGRSGSHGPAGPLNGTALNGTALNGTALNGTALNGNGAGPHPSDLIIANKPYVPPALSAARAHLGLTPLPVQVSSLGRPRPSRRSLVSSAQFTADVATLGAVCVVLQTIGRGWLPERAGLALAAWMAATLLGLQLSGLYRRPVLQFRRLTWVRCLANAAVVAAGETVIVPMIGGRQRPGLALVLLGAGTITAIGGRELLHGVRRRCHRQGKLLARVLLVGDGPAVAAMGRQLDLDPRHGVRVVGVVETTTMSPEGAWPVVAAVVGALREIGVDRVVVIAPAHSLATADLVMRTVADLGVDAEMVTGLEGVAGRRLRVTQVGEHNALWLSQTRRDGWRYRVKRTADFTVALILLILTAPVVAAAMVAIWVDSGRPLLFRQVRAGRGGREFTMLKLRTMVPDAERRLIDVVAMNEADGPLFKLRLDPRITPVGRLLRRLSIDELPQLWNVLKGEMSMVGPRPAILSELEAWTPDVRQRLRVRPGVTGLWQVSGRSTTSYADYVRCDQSYVENWSLAGDLIILARTVKVVLTGHGAT